MVLNIHMHARVRVSVFKEDTDLTLAQQDASLTLKNYLAAAQLWWYAYGPNKKQN